MGESLKNQVQQLIDDSSTQTKRPSRIEKKHIQSETPNAITTASTIATVIPPSSVEKTVKFIIDRFSTLEKAANTFSAIGFALDVAAAYLGGIAAGLAIPTLGISAAAAGPVAAVLAIASLPFHGASIILNILDEEK